MKRPTTCRDAYDSALLALDLAQMPACFFSNCSTAIDQCLWLWVLKLNSYTTCKCPLLQQMLPPCGLSTDSLHLIRLCVSYQRRHPSHQELLRLWRSNVFYLVHIRETARSWQWDGSTFSVTHKPDILEEHSALLPKCRMWIGFFHGMAWHRLWPSHLRGSSLGNAMAWNNPQVQKNFSNLHSLSSVSLLNIMISGTDQANRFMLTHVLHTMHTEFAREISHVITNVSQIFVKPSNWPRHLKCRRRFFRYLQGIIICLFESVKKVKQMKRDSLRKPYFICTEQVTAMKLSKSCLLGGTR